MVPNYHIVATLLMSKLIISQGWFYMNMYKPLPLTSIKFGNSYYLISNIYPNLPA